MATAENAPLGASGGWSGVVKLWSLDDGRQSAAWQAHDGEITGLFFIDQDRIIVSSGYDGQIVKWDLAGNRMMQAKNASAVTALAANSRSGVLVSGHKDGSVIQWDMHRLAPLRHERVHTDRVRAVAISNDARLVASSDADGAVYLWREDGEPRRLARLPTDIRTLDFSPDDRYLYGGTWFHVHRWNIAAKTTERLPTAHRGIINDLELSTDGKELFTISRQTDSAVLALDAVTGKTLRDFGRHDLCGSALTLSRDGSFLLTTSDDGSVRIWSLRPASHLSQ